MAHDPFEFHRDEYASLREEILAAQAERSRLESWGLAGILGVYAWLIANPVTGAWAALSVLGWWLPLGAALYLRHRITALSKGIKKAGGYLVELDKRYADDLLVGWHARLRRDGNPRLVSDPMRELWDKVVSFTAVIAVVASGLTIALSV